MGEQAYTKNDTALDVKDEFEKLFNDGKGVQEITDGLTAEFEKHNGLRR